MLSMATLYCTFQGFVLQTSVLADCTSFHHDVSKSVSSKRWFKWWVRIFVQGDDKSKRNRTTNPFKPTAMSQVHPAWLSSVTSLLNFNPRNIDIKQTSLQPLSSSEWKWATLQDSGPHEFWGVWKVQPPLLGTGKNCSWGEVFVPG